MKDAIRKLDCGKACGDDAISAEHLKYASNRILPLLSMCFTSCFVHGWLPAKMISVILVPIIKDKTGKINCSSNYRPIALSSILSKVLETIIFNKLQYYLVTCDNQFGFKPKHGTDMCIYVLKEIIHKYHDLNSSVFLCFLDASKAFDRVNHVTLFKKLLGLGTPAFLVRILCFWYSQQRLVVRWGNTISEPFGVTNGVRQGGILSPHLFNVYMNDLSRDLNACSVGCMNGDTRYNHLMYADDLVVFSLSSRGLQQLLDVCSEYGIIHDIKYNTQKSVVTIVRSKYHKNIVFPDFLLNENVLPTSSKVRYLGHIITEDMRDDHDIMRQCRKMYAQGNMLRRKFYMCSPDVKVSLFKTFCTPLYTAQLWWNYRLYNLKKINVAYNDIMRLLLRLPRYHSASHLFANVNVSSFHACLRRLVYSFICRLDGSENIYITGLVSVTQSLQRFVSRIWKHWAECLCSPLRQQPFYL